MAGETGDISMPNHFNMSDNIGTPDSATSTSCDQIIDAGDDSSSDERRSNSSDDIFDAASEYSQSTATSTDDLEDREEPHLLTQEHSEGEHLPSEETRERMNAIVREGMQELRAMLAEIRKEVRALFQEWETRMDAWYDESDKRLDLVFARGKKVSTRNSRPSLPRSLYGAFRKLIVDCET